MKWLRDIFKKKSGGDGRSSLGLDEVEAWLEEKGNDSQFIERLDAIYRKIEAAGDSLSQEISDLSKAEADGSTPPKLLRAGLAARGELSKQLSSFREKLIPPKKKDLESAFQHHWTAVKGLERTVTTFGRAQRYVAALFPKNIESINSELAEVSRLLVELEKEIGTRRKLAEESWFCRDLAASLQKELSRIEELKKITKQNAGLFEESKTRLLHLDDELKRHANSDEGKKLEELKRKLEEIRKEKAVAEEDLASLIAPLTKAIARIMKQGASDRIDLKHEDIFSALMKTPGNVQDEEIAGSLEELRNHLATLGLKDRKKEKTLEHIDQLISKRSLQAARARQASAEKRICELEGLIKEGSREGLRLKDETSLAKKKAKGLEESLDLAQKDLAALLEKAASHESELNDRLARIQGAPIRVDISSDLSSGRK